LGRHWHFLTIVAWIFTGLLYVVLMIVTDEWRRLIPTSWHVFTDAARAAQTYARLELPPPAAGLPYNALQQLTYAAVVFLLAPLSIATGAAMSPAVIGRFPWYARLFGGKQAARSIHFLCLVGFVLFTVGHTAMVIVHGLPTGFAKIVLGS